MELPSHHHHHRQMNTKKIISEPAEVQDDPSERFDPIAKRCSDEKEEGNSLKTEKGFNAVTESHNVLTRLKQDGCDLIGSLETSTKIRTERQLVQRSKTESEFTKLTTERLEDVKRVNVELQESWKNTSTMTGPHQLTVELGEIQKLSSEVLNAQQELIARLRDETSRAEQAIQREIERQTDDLGIMRIRMREHLDSTRSTQRWQLDNIDAALGEDYAHLLSDHSKQMDEMLNELATEEDAILSELNDIGRYWSNNLKETDVLYYNESCQSRKTLTDDIYRVETELEKLKADFTLNNQVLDYNCRVLKMREQERIDFASRQRKKIIKLTERYQQLKSEYDESQKKEMEKDAKLKKEIEMLKRDCQAMEMKYFKIKNTNDQQLEDLCDLGEDRLDQLLSELARIDERIFVEILEKPWDGLVGQRISCGSPTLDQGPKRMEEIVKQLESELKFLLVRPNGNYATNGTSLERMMKALDVCDLQEFETLLEKLGSVPEKEMMRQLIEFVRRHHSKSVNDVKTRPYLTNAQTIREFFEQFKENAVPKSRLDMWKMLAKALIQYERILRDRLSLAANIVNLKDKHKSTKN